MNNRNYFIIVATLFIAKISFVTNSSLREFKVIALLGIRDSCG